VKGRILLPQKREINKSAEIFPVARIKCTTKYPSVHIYIGAHTLHLGQQIELDYAYATGLYQR
jgi:hypothetical protein